MTEESSKKILSMTLTQLEGSDWGEPTLDSPIFKRCFRLRHKKIGALTADDLRALVSQEIGLEFLMPKVLGMLKSHPLLQAEYFSGDLLCAVLRINHSFYEHHPEYRELASYALGEARRKFDELKDFERDVCIEAIEEAAATFGEPTLP